jgi:hypothetical protein
MTGIGEEPEDSGESSLVQMPNVKGLDKQVPLTSGAKTLRKATDGVHLGDYEANETVARVSKEELNRRFGGRESCGREEEKRKRKASWEINS